jgi:hypothetical protein
MPKKEVTVGYDEIFYFAQENFGMSWNQCCDVFYHGHETLSSPECPNKHIYLQDTEGELEYMQEHRDSKTFNTYREKTSEVLVAFMKKHNLKEMLVLNSK